MSETAQQFLGFRAHRAERQAAGQGKAGQEDVLEHRQVGGKRCLLRDQGNALRKRVTRGGERQRRAVESNLARAGLDMPGDDAGKRRFACTVCAEQAHHLARTQGQGRVRQGLRLPERLGHAARGEERRGAIGLDLGVVLHRRCAGCVGAGRPRHGSGHSISFAKTVSVMVGSISSILLEVTIRIGTVISFSGVPPFRWSIIASAERTPIR